MLIDALPQEIIELVVSSITGRQDLKALREAHSVFLVPASSCLFREVHVSPNSHSFDRALAVAKHYSLSQHVRSLKYHFGMLGEYYPGFEAFKNEYYSVRRPGEYRDPSEITAEVLWCYNCWLEELDGQRTFELCDEEEELRQLCSRLPKLEEITTLFDDIDDIAEPKDYIGLRTGMAPSEDEGEYRFARLFRAVRGRSLTKIAAKAITWQQLQTIVEAGEDEDIETFEELMLPDTLRYLEIGLYNPLDEQSLSDVEARCRWLDAFLSKAPDIRTLRLDFDELQWESHAELMIPTSRTIFAHHWPQLHSLKLEAIATPEGEICDFLLGHTAKLRSLELGDIELVRMDGNEDTPSVMRLFRQLHDGLRLDTFKIRGNFTNRLTQAWYVDIGAPSHPLALRTMIEQYVCRLRPDSWSDDHDMGREPRFAIPFHHYMEDDHVEPKEWQHFSDDSLIWSDELLS